MLHVTIDDGQAQEKHLLQMLSGVIQWIDPPDVAFEAVRRGKSERFSASRFSHVC